MLPPLLVWGGSWMMNRMVFSRVMMVLVMVMSTCVTVSSGAYLTSRRITTDTGHEDSSPWDKRYWKVCTRPRIWWKIWYWPIKKKQANQGSKIAVTTKIEAYWLCWQIYSNDNLTAKKARSKFMGTSGSVPNLNLNLSWSLRVRLIWVKIYVKTWQYASWVVLQVRFVPCSSFPT